MRFLILAISFLTISNIFSDEFDDLICYHPYYVPQAKKYSQGHLIENCQIMPGYNAEAKVDLCKKIDVFVRGTYLFFQPHEKGLTYAYTVDDPNASIGNFFEMHSNYKSAFRVALGFSTSYDDWTYRAEYTRFHFSKVKQIDQKSINSWIHFNTLDPSLMVMTNIKAKWTAKLDILDILFARAFYSGTHLILIPTFGVKGGSLDQNFNTDAIRESDEAILYSKDKIDSYLVGLTGGIKSKFLIFWGFNLYADFNTSLFYQKFRVKNKQNSASDPSLLFDNSVNKISYINPSLMISSGLEWGSYFSKNSYHISFLMGYEANIFFNQNLMIELKELRINNKFQEIGDLYLHGIVANFTLNF